MGRSVLATPIAGFLLIGAFACDPSTGKPADEPAIVPAPKAEAETPTDEMPDEPAAVPSDPTAVVDDAPKGLASRVAAEVAAVRERPVVAPGADVLATVGAVALPKADFDAIYSLKTGKYVERGREIPPTAARRYRSSLLERLVYNELLRQAAAKARVDYDPVELRHRKEQQRRGIADWDTHLRRRGESEASLEAMLIAELREKALLEAEGALSFTRAELEAEYEKVRANYDADEERVRASHILVDFGAKAGTTVSDADALARAQELHKEATAPGADFAEVARAHSSAPGAAEGGDIGIFTYDRMAEEFSEACRGLKPGEISEPVKTKFGYHIIKLMGRWPPGELPLAALEDQIGDRLRQRNMHGGRRALKQRLHDATAVLWMLDIETGQVLDEGVAPVVDRSPSKTDPDDDGESKEDMKMGSKAE